MKTIRRLLLPLAMAAIGGIILLSDCCLLVWNEAIKDKNDLVGVYQDDGFCNVRNLVLYSNGTYCCEVRLPESGWNVMTNAWRFSSVPSATVCFCDFPGPKGGSVLRHNYYGCPVTKSPGRVILFMGTRNSTEILFYKDRASTIVDAIYIVVGLAQALLIFVGVPVWIILHLRKKRMKKKSEANGQPSADSGLEPKE